MIKSILKYAGKYKILTVVATVMVVIAVAAQILPYIFAYQIISPLIAGESVPWQFAVGRVVGVAVCLVLNFVFYLGGLSLSHIAAFNTLYNLRVSLQGKMEKLPLGVVQEKGTGNLKKLFVDDVESMELLLAHAIPEGIGNLLIPIGVFIAMFAVDWKLALLTLVMLPVGVWAVMMMTRAGFAKMDSYYRSAQVMNNTIDDTTLNYAQVKAITSGNPKIMRKMEIEQRLGQLSSLENDYRNNRYRYQEIILHTPKQLEDFIRRKENLKRDIELRDAHKDDLIQIGKQKFAERKDAGELLVRVLKSQQYVGKTIGMFRGFRLVAMENGLYMSNVKLVGANEYKVGIGDSGIGAITRLENETDGFEKSISSTEKERADEEAKLEQAKIEVEKPFEYAEEVESLQAELSAIDAELDLNKEEAPIVLDNEAEPEKAEIEVLDETEEEVEIV